MAVAFTTSTGVSSTRLSYELEKVTGAGAALGGGVGGGAVIVVAIYSRLLQLEFSHVGREHPHVIPYFYCCTRLVHVFVHTVMFTTHQKHIMDASTKCMRAECTYELYVNARATV